MTNLRNDVNPAQRKRRSIRTHTILVVEDDREVRDVVASLLLDEGYNVLEAGDGFEALEMLGAAPVDLLFTDVRMPGMDGYELARRAKQLHPQLPVIYTTGYSRRLPGGGEALCGAILSKPWRRQELLAEFARALTDRG